MSSSTSKVSRRTLFFGAGTAGAVAATVGLLPTAQTVAQSPAAPKVKPAIGHLDHTGEPPVDRIVFQQMGIGFDRPGRIDGNHLNIIARRFRNMGQSAAADPSKSVDSNRDHFDALFDVKPL